MKAQEIYLSPKNILSYLTDFEKRLPRKEYVEYTPRVITQECITDENLNLEARFMLDFLGMDSYTPECRFCQTAANTGGCINLNPERIVKIDVSEEFRNNPNATVAILAHEICHKYLYSYNIYFPSATIINEVYTDLCTIFVGFGELILKGYKTTSYNTTHYLGYLNINMYSDCNAIIKTVNGKMSNETNDYFLEEVIELWNKNPDTRGLYLDCFKKLEESHALFHRNVATLNSIISQIENRITNDLDNYNKLFFDDHSLFDENKEPLRPISIFAKIYESTLIDHNENVNQLNKNNEILSELIVKLIDIDSKIDTSNIASSQQKCPFCGHSYDHTKIKGEATILKCSKCKKNFYMNRTEFNIVGTRKQLKDKESKHTEEMLQDSREIIRKEAYNRGILHATSDFNKRLNSLPKWLGWLVRKFTKEN